jgi:hypothetical protein
LIPPTLPEVRRLILAMAGPQEEREFRLGWSLWRRAHQALAKRCHTARRALRREGALTLGRHTTRQARGSVPEPMVAPLTHEQWERIRPLMPPQEPPTGRPRRDHRQVLAGMLFYLRKRCFVAGSARRGVRAMADGVWTLPPMAQGRPLAADSGVAPALPMMQTAHSRDRSGTVGLEVVFSEVGRARRGSGHPSGYPHPQPKERDGR